ncbi:ABC transporter permease [Promicromonospora sp. MEB111]|uniref:ABC transporter permease n=1 Tax=Promicromonospora sp. MEB111 TaxID=3040301 RepID=UPI00254D4B7D|nr:ABC transporter permease [Promicromonospora sp. MEB111]
MTDTDLVRKPPAARVVAAAAGLTPLERTGVALVTAVVLFCVVTPFLPLYAPYAQDLSRAFVPPLTDAAHPLGTDMLGRDLASRLALGGLVSLGIVLLVVVVNAIIGMVVGLLAGYHGGRLDNVLMGWADVQLAMPVILVLIALSAAVGPSVWLMVVTLAATYWVGYARVARGTAMTLRDRDFVLVPRIQGASATWTISRHIAPGVAVQMLILASSDIGAVLLLTSSFDYLGLGVQPPVPSWGLLISEGQKYIRQAPYLSVVPGIAIFLVVIGTNLISQRFTAERDLRSARRRK